MIHASAAQTMGLGVLADGRSFCKPLIKTIGVVAPNGSQAVLQKEHVTLELVEILPRYSDVPLLFDIQSILGSAKLIPFTQLFRKLVIGIGAGPAPIIVPTFGVSVYFPYRADETMFLKSLHR